ncbi:hypothetical protein CPB97_010414 [Podila verticillata]|nr:hypothetical protein CPB97_010414 [Podila verticillata]
MGIDSMLISVSNNKVENEVRTAYLGFGSNVRSSVLLTSKRLREKRGKPMEDNISLPTLATPLRNVALGIQYRVKLVKCNGKETMEMKKAKRKKDTAEA